ncbi:MAG: alpha/beta hydrolase, partial [Burkholderiales bacterium]|nr:alpha/beta hydrolase [Burkholderiales bacterium]
MRDGAAAFAPSPYRGPRWLPGAHAQTIWPFLLKRPDVAYRRERVETADGDFWDFDWLA